MNIDNFLEVFNTDLESILRSLADMAPDIIAALFVFAGFWVLYLATKGLIRRALLRAKFEEVLIRILIHNIYRTIVMIFGVVMALNQLGINVLAALTGFGIAGIAIGFASKDVLSNIIAGFMIFWDKPFRVGQWITVSGQYGKVHDITLRTTRIRTRNNTYVVIPNQKVIDEVLVNHSRKGKTRLDAEVGIAYKEDIDNARKVLLEAISTIDKIIDEPAPRVVVESLGDSSVNLVVQGWIADAEDESGIKYFMIEESKKALDKAGIEIPFPHLQMYIDDVKQSVVDKIKDNKK